LIAQGDFTLVFQTCVYHTLTRLTPPITHSFSITVLPYLLSSFLGTYLEGCIFNFHLSDSS
jgi:hypothetical protein